MKIAYIILAHTDPAHIARLCRKITVGTQNHAFVHVDLKQDITPFKQACSGISQVHFVKQREKVYWAGFHSITATIQAYQTALDYGEFDYYQILQGLDYPIWSNREIDRFFEQNRGTEFIRAIDDTNATELMVRFRYVLYWKFDSENPFIKLYHNFNFAQLLWFKHLLPVKKPYLSLHHKQYHIYRGWAHFALTDAAVRYIVDFYESNPEFNRYFEHVYAADESYFHTILFNSPFVSKTVDGKPVAEEDRSYAAYLNLTYFEYPKEGVTVFTHKEDYKKLLDTGYPFFRKATSNSHELLDYIDAEHAKAEGGQSR